MYEGYSVKALEFNSDALGPKLINSITYKAIKNSQPGKIDETCLDINGADKEHSCQRERNTAVISLLIQSDEMCQEHVKSIYGNEAASNLTTGSIVNLASGLATVLAAPATKSALSAVAFFANAEQSLINETVYKDLLTPAVVKKIRESRDAKVAEFTTHFNDPVQKYSVQAALWDVIKYHQTCAFMYGLQKAIEEGEQPAVKNQIAKLEEKLIKLSDKKDAREKSLKNDSKTDEQITGDPTVQTYNELIGQVKNNLLALTSLESGR